MHEAGFAKSLPDALLRCHENTAAAEKGLNNSVIARREMMASRVFFML